MRHQIFRAKGLCALKVDDELLYGFFVQIGFRRREVDEIVGVHEDGGNIILLPKLLEFCYIGFVERLHCPSAGIAAEDLHAGAAELVGALDGKGEAAGDGDVKADSHGQTPNEHTCWLMNGRVISSFTINVAKAMTFSRKRAVRASKSYTLPFEFEV